MRSGLSMIATASFFSFHPFWKAMSKLSPHYHVWQLVRSVVHCDLTSSLCYHLFKRKLFQTSCASFRYKFANISCSAMFLVGRRGFLQKKLILRSLRFLKAKHPGLYEEFLRLLFKQHWNMNINLIYLIMAVLQLAITR